MTELDFYLRQFKNCNVKVLADGYCIDERKDELFTHKQLTVNIKFSVVVLVSRFHISSFISMLSQTTYVTEFHISNLQFKSNQFNVLEHLDPDSNSNGIFSGLLCRLCCTNWYQRCQLLSFLKTNHTFKRNIYGLDINESFHAMVAWEMAFQHFHQVNLFTLETYLSSYINCLCANSYNRSSNVIFDEDVDEHARDTGVADIDTFNNIPSMCANDGKNKIAFSDALGTETTTTNSINYSNANLDNTSLNVRNEDNEASLLNRPLRDIVLKLLASSTDTNFLQKKLRQLRSDASITNSLFKYTSVYEYDSAKSKTMYKNHRNFIIYVLKYQKNVYLQKNSDIEDASKGDAEKNSIEEATKAPDDSDLLYDFNVIDGIDLNDFYSSTGLYRCVVSEVQINNEIQGQEKAFNMYLKTDAIPPEMFLEIAIDCETVGDNYKTLAKCTMENEKVFSICTTVYNCQFNKYIVWLLVLNDYNDSQIQSLLFRVSCKFMKKFNSTADMSSVADRQNVHVLLFNNSVDLVKSHIFFESNNIYLYKSIGMIDLPYIRLGFNIHDYDDPCFVNTLLYNEEYDFLLQNVDLVQITRCKDVNDMQHIDGDKKEQVKILQYHDKYRKSMQHQYMNTAHQRTNSSNFILYDSDTELNIDDYDNDDDDNFDTHSYCSDDNDNINAAENTDKENINNAKVRQAATTSRMRKGQSRLRFIPGALDFNNSNNDTNMGKSAHGDFANLNMEQFYENNFPNPNTKTGTKKELLSAQQSQKNAESSAAQTDHEMSLLLQETQCKNFNNNAKVFPLMFINSRLSNNTIYQFNSNAIHFDLLDYAKSMQLNKFSLKDICEKYLPNSQGKLDLQSITIRLTYFLLQHGKHVGEILNENIFNGPQHWTVDEIQNLNFALSNIDTSDVQFLQTNSKLSHNEYSQFPSIPHILVYNIIDCIVLHTLYKKFCVFDTALEYQRTFTNEFYNCLNKCNSQRILNATHFSMLKRGTFYSKQVKSIFLQTILDNLQIDTVEHYNRMTANHIVNVQKILRNIDIFESTLNYTKFKKAISKSYPGAVNYSNHVATIGNTVTLDFESYYINILMSHFLDQNNLIVVKYKTLRQLNATVIDRLLECGILKIYAYTTVTSFEQQVHPEYIGPEPMQFFESMCVLRNAMDTWYSITGDNQRFFLLFTNYHVDLPHFLFDILFKRRKLKKIKQAKNISDVDKMIAGVKEKSLKLYLTSFYGLWGANESNLNNLPGGAFICLSGQSIMVIVCRILTLLYYKLIAKKRNCPLNNDSVDISAAVLTPSGERVNLRRVDELLEYYSSIPDLRYGTVINRNKKFPFLCDDPRLTSNCYIAHENRKLSTINYSNRCWANTLINNLIVYTDTDGCKLWNFDFINLEYIHETLQPYINKGNCSNLPGGKPLLNLIYDDESNTHCFITPSKKKGIFIDHITNRPPTDIKDAYITKCVGYAKQPMYVINNILTYVFKLCAVVLKLNAKFNENFQIDTARVVYDCFNYLYSCNQYDLCKKLKLNRHKNNKTNRARIIQEVSDRINLDRKIPLFSVLSRVGIQYTDFLQGKDSSSPPVVTPPNHSSMVTTITDDTDCAINSATAGSAVGANDTEDVRVRNSSKVLAVRLEEIKKYPMSLTEEQYILPIDWVKLNCPPLNYLKFLADKITSVVKIIDTALLRTNTTINTRVLVQSVYMKWIHKNIDANIIFKEASKKHYEFNEERLFPGNRSLYYVHYKEIDNIQKVDTTDGCNGSVDENVKLAFIYDFKGYNLPKELLRIMAKYDFSEDIDRDEIIAYMHRNHRKYESFRKSVTAE